MSAIGLVLLPNVSTGSAACFVCKHRAAPRGKPNPREDSGHLIYLKFKIRLSNFPVLFSQFKITSWCCCCCCYSSSNPQLNESIFDKVIGVLVRVPSTIIAITQFKYKSSQKLREFTATSYTFPPPLPLYELGTCSTIVTQSFPNDNYKCRQKRSTTESFPGRGSPAFGGGTKLMGKLCVCN